MKEISMNADSLKNLNTSIDTINKRIIDKIIHLMHTKHISQQKLAEESGISQSTISKLLKGDTHFSLNQLICISHSLGENMFDTITSDDLGHIEKTRSDTLLELTETDNIILNTDRPAFRGYLNNSPYHAYFFSTVSGVRDILTGELSFTETPSKRCKVDFKLYTGKQDLLNRDIIKHYTGCMLISIPLSTCYCILKNEEIGELSFISFHHMFLLYESMRCRSCSVLTTSSGEQRRPTLNRMIISDIPFDLDDKNDKTFLFGQLKLNNKKILIDNKDLENILTQPPYNTIDSSSVYDAITNSSIESIDENTILGLDIETDLKIALINSLRSASLADVKNKISTNTDEFLYSYLQSKKITS